MQTMRDLIKILEDSMNGIVESKDELMTDKLRSATGLSHVPKKVYDEYYEALGDTENFRLNYTLSEINTVYWLLSEYRNLYNDALLAMDNDTNTQTVQYAKEIFDYYRFQYSMLMEQQRDSEEQY